jgi:hypothetical protein
MSSPRAHEDSQSDMSQPVRYPINHVLAVIDKPGQLRSALAALESGGFLKSELGVRSGEAMADVLAASSGRTGWSDLAMRFSEWIGLANDEMGVKDHGAHFVNFLGRYTMVTIAP